KQQHAGQEPVADDAEDLQRTRTTEVRDVLRWPADQNQESARQTHADLHGERLAGAENVEQLAAKDGVHARPASAALAAATGMPAAIVWCQIIYTWCIGQMMLLQSPFQLAPVCCGQVGENVLQADLVNEPLGAELFNDPLAADLFDEPFAADLFDDPL